jgi:hypothetical protein
MTDIPKIQGELVAFRGWSYNSDLQLVPQNEMFGAWLPGENVAKCHAHMYNIGITGITTSWTMNSWGGVTKVSEEETPKIAEHTAPHPDCGCGLYVRYNLDRVIQDAFQIVGAVTVYGKIEAHKKHDGLRAEKSRIAAISSGIDKKLYVLIAREIAKEYGVPYVPLNELENVASEYGQRIPEDLIPETWPPEMEDKADITFHAGGYVSGGRAFKAVKPTQAQIRFLGSSSTFNGSMQAVYDEAQLVDEWDGEEFDGTSVNKPQKRKPKRNSARQGPPQSRGSQFKKNKKN